MTSPHERQGQQEHAAIAAAFDVDPVDWVLEWALDDWGQAWLFASQMWEYGLEAPPVPSPDVDAMVERITPDVLADLRLHGFVSNRAACTVRYVWTGTRCRCEHEHGGMDFPSDDQWPSVIQPPDRRRATFECADGHVTTVTPGLGVAMPGSWTCNTCQSPAEWRSGMQPGTLPPGWQPGRSA